MFSHLQINKISIQAHEVVCRKFVLRVTVDVIRVINILHG